MDRVKAFAKLHELLIYYTENRDMPVTDGFNFFDEVHKLCQILNLDYEEFKKVFHLKEGSF